MVPSYNDDTKVCEVCNAWMDLEDEICWRCGWEQQKEDRVEDES